MVVGFVVAVEGGSRAPVVRVESSWVSRWKISRGRSFRVVGVVGRGAVVTGNSVSQALLLATAYYRVQGTKYFEERERQLMAMLKEEGRPKDLGARYTLPRHQPVDPPVSAESVAGLLALSAQVCQCRFGLKTGLYCAIGDSRRVLRQHTDPKLGMPQLNWPGLHQQRQCCACLEAQYLADGLALARPRQQVWIALWMTDEKRH